MEYSEASSKKSRKPYTLTKARESWSNDEHERFIKALQLYNRDWKKIETYVGTKTVVQIRSHAQKYFQKIMKSGITDAIPPPRPKRRASDPPHGASCHPEAKHMRLQPDAPSRQGSGRDDDSDDGMQVHHNHTGHQPQQQQHQQHHQQQQHSKQHEMLEPSAQLEASRALISCQGLQHVYLYMASLFTQPPVDSAGMLQRLSTRDRHVLAVLMKSLVEELNHQQHTHQHSHPHSDPQQHPEAHLQQLQEDEQHQEQVHHSGSGGHSNGATVNTTAGTGPAHADAAAAAQAAGAAPTSAGTQPGTGAATGAGEAAAGVGAGEEAGQQAVVPPPAAGLPHSNGPGFLEQAQPVLQQQQEAEGLPVLLPSRLQQQQQHLACDSPQEQQQPLQVASPAADADQPLQAASRRPASSSPPMDAPVAYQAGSPGSRRCCSTTPDAGAAAGAARHHTSRVKRCNSIAGMRV